MAVDETAPKPGVRYVMVHLKATPERASAGLTYNYRHPNGGEKLWPRPLRILNWLVVRDQHGNETAQAMLSFSQADVEWLRTEMAQHDVTVEDGGACFCRQCTNPETTIGTANPPALVP